MATDGPTVAEYLESWLELQQTQLQPSTWESYKANLGRYLLPAFGETVLNDLQATELSRLYVRLLTAGGKDGAPLSLRTIRYVHSVLHKALEDARRRGEIAVNVSSDATLPRIDPHRQSPDELRVWTAAQLRTFLDHASGHPLAILWELAAGTGMRRGELLGLRWRDVDLEARHLTVRHSLSVVRRHVRLKPPKTGRVRVLSLDRRSCDALVRRRQQQERWQATRGPTWSNEWDLVFTTDSGRPLVPDVVSRQFRQLVLAAPVPTIRFHDVRHTHASFEAGAPIKVVSERLGHASIQLTLNVYAHVLPSMDRDAVDRYAAHVHGAG